MDSAKLLTVDPAKLAQKAEALEPLEPEARVREDVDKTRDVSRRSAVPPLLRLAAEAVDVRLPARAATSHRKLIGPLLVAAKRSFRKVAQPLINEVLRPQVNFNEQLIDALAFLVEQMERDEQQRRRWQADVERRLAALEKRLGQ